MEVEITHLNMKFSENVQRNMMTNELREIIARKIGFEVNEILLKIGQIYLSDENLVTKTFESNFKIVYNNSVRYVKVNDLTFATCIDQINKINLNGITGQTLVKDLKKQIASKLELQVDNMVLKNELDQELGNELTLEKCIVKRLIVVFVKGKIEIRVILVICGKNIAVKAYKDMKTKEFMEQVFIKTRIPMNDFNLTLNGIVLDLENTLEFYEIENESIVVAVSTADGGSEI